MDDNLKNRLIQGSIWTTLTDANGTHKPMHRLVAAVASNQLHEFSKVVYVVSLQK